MSRSDFGEVVYKKADVEDAENEDIWDDTLLIKMYDEAISKTYQSLGEQSASTQKKQNCAPKLQWHIGDRCMAPYYDDQLWYPAVITKLHLDDGKCEVLYDVYDEIACVDIADLTKQRRFPGNIDRRLPTRSALPRIGRRYDRPSFSRFAIRPSRGHSCKRRQQWVGRRGTKRRHSEQAKIAEMGYGDGKRRKYKEECAKCPTTADVAVFENYISSGLQQSIYMTRILNDFWQQKPTEFDLEGTSNGNTAEDPLPKKEELQTQVTESEKSPPCIVPQPAESKKDQHSSVPSLMPPPPTAFSGLVRPSNEEALSSMLMSWYMTGYHTGYYQALQDQKKEYGTENIQQ